MIDYYKTYRKFLAAKQQNTTKAKAKELGLERHHKFPKSMGGRKKVWLSEYDHCIAHLLLNVAMVQHKMKALDYGPRPCLWEKKLNPGTYWNPISKLRIKITDSNGSKTMTLTDSAKLAAEWSQCEMGKSEAVGYFASRILSTCCCHFGKHKYFGKTFELVVPAYKQ